MSKVLEKLRIASEKDPDILVDRDKLDETLGTDANYLEEVLGLTKSDMIRLERLGRAFKARYQTQNTRNKDITGPHRIRWVIFKELV